jgi:abortive infection bacteriophage resistance protein
LNDEKSKEIYDKFINIAKEKKGKATSMFWKAYREKYDEEIYLPSRMLLEECMIWEVVNLYKILNITDSKLIATTYASYFVDLRKWLQLIVNVRNISAHCARLRNRIFIIKPRIEDVILGTLYPQETGGNGRLEVISNFFTFTLIVNYLLQQIDTWNHWIEKLEALFIKSPDISKEAMGFYNNRQEKICPSGLLLGRYW